MTGAEQAEPHVYLRLFARRGDTTDVIHASRPTCRAGGGSTNRSWSILLRERTVARDSEAASPGYYDG
ncbi:hypothetical protein GCM10027614_35760 [Micromonospora vulcania]